jgi:beta-lactamase regulating signal transducer with metallopeptidase domain
MSIATVLWILAVAGLVTGVAGAVSAALRRLHRPERWVWLVALAVTATLPFLPAPSSVPELGAEVDAVTRVIPIAQMMTFASSSLPEPARVSIPWIPILWGAASVATVLAMLGGAWSLARRRETWPRRRIDGDLLRVSDHFGPAVVGWIDPEIVLPAWAVDLERRQRRLILRHENEHRWARDPQLLGLGVLLLAAAPWNPFAWLQLRGLRRAVEFDCDARVLVSGASPRAYGRLLLSVQLDGGRGALFAPALREPASFLERRLQTMKLRDRPVARLRVAGLSLVAIVLTVVACETPRPTESEPVAAVSARAQVAGASDSYRARIEQLAEQYERLDPDVRWRLDGVEIAAPGDRFDYGRITEMTATFVNQPDGEPMVMQVELTTTSAERIQVIEVPPDDSMLAEVRNRIDRFGTGDDSAAPEAGPVPALDSELVMFTVQPNGAVDIRRSGAPLVQTVTTSEVGDVWRHDAESNPGLTAHVRADPDTPAGLVREVMSALRGAGATRISVQEWPATASDGPVPGLRSPRDTARSTELRVPDAPDSLRTFGDSLRSSRNSSIRPIGESWGIRPDDDGPAPLVYVDGVRVPFDAHDVLTDRISPQDIERIEVVKGTAASELYGPDAEGGVILIFTKKND